MSGYCQLDKGRPVTLQARQASVLRITRGRVWLTFNPALNAPSARLGDHFLGRGEIISLAAGEAVVMESYGPRDAPSAYYSCPAAEAGSGVAMLTASGWRASVLGPLLDLRLARGLVVGVVAGAIGITVNFATTFVAQRDRKYSTKRAFKPQSGYSCVGCSGH